VYSSGYGGVNEVIRSKRAKARAYGNSLLCLVFAEARCLNDFLDRKKEACIMDFEFNRKEGERCKAVGAGECFKKFAR
jgi:hypothetical protein